MPVTTSTVVFEVPNGPTIRLRVRPDGRALVVIDDGRRQIALPPSHAAQVASGIDEALSRLNRTGHLRS